MDHNPQGHRYIDDPEKKKRRKKVPEYQYVCADYATYQAGVWQEQSHEILKFSVSSAYDDAEEFSELIYAHIQSERMRYEESPRHLVSLCSKWNRAM